MKKNTLMNVFLIIIILSLIILNYSPKQEYLESGVFMDYNSFQRGVNIEECHLDSIDEINFGDESEFWFGCNIINYSSPVLVRIYFPFEVAISLYGSCFVEVNTTTGVQSEEKCYQFNARVINDTILEIIYDSSDIPYEQLKLNANIFRRVGFGEFVFKSFQISNNPLPFMKDVMFTNSFISYSLKFKRDYAEIKLAQSNFIPEISNELTGDYEYKRGGWNSGSIPTESILYVETPFWVKTSEFINYFLVLMLGFIIGNKFDKFFNKKS